MYRVADVITGYSEILGDSSSNNAGQSGLQYSTLLKNVTYILVCSGKCILLCTSLLFLRLLQSELVQVPSSSEDPQHELMALWLELLSAEEKRREY